MPWIRFPFLLLIKPRESFIEREKEGERERDFISTEAQFCSWSDEAEDDANMTEQEVAFSVLFCSVTTLEEYLYEMLLKKLFLTMYIIFWSLWQPGFGIFSGTRKRVKAHAHSHHCHSCPAHVPCLYFCWYELVPLSWGMYIFLALLPYNPLCGIQPCCDWQNRKWGNSAPFCFFFSQGFLFSARISTQEYLS